MIRRSFHGLDGSIIYISLPSIPANLSSFRISATYDDTLASPSNLERWKPTSEAPCFLYYKDTWIISHIFDTSKVALSQGRFTFQHDSVLRIIINNIRSFYKNIKSTAPLSKQPIKMKSVKKKEPKWKIKNKNSFPSGIWLGVVTGSRWPKLNKVKEISL